MAAVQSQTEVSPVSRRDPLAAPDLVVLKVLASGFLLSFIGFFLPWYYVSYNPPAAPVRVAGHVLNRFSLTYDGTSGQQAGRLLGFLPASSWGEQVMTGAAMTGIVSSSLIIVFCVSALSVPALAGLRSRWLRPLRFRLVKFPIDIVNAVAAVYGLAGAVSFLLLAIGIGRFGIAAQLAQVLGDTPAAMQASAYLHVSLGDGLWLVLLGLLIVIGALGKRFLATAGIFIACCAALAWVHPSLIWPLLHTLGY